MKEANKKIIDAVLEWRKNWCDMEDEIEAEKGCNCEVCKLIRACDDKEREE